MRASMVGIRESVNICRSRGIGRAMPDLTLTVHTYGGANSNPRRRASGAAGTGRVRNWHFRMPVELNMQIELRLCLGPRKFQEFAAQ